MEITDMSVRKINSSDYPLVTFALFSFNQERYIKEAIESAADQNYRNMEILLSDDCSTDSTFKIISDFFSNYRGPHKLTINRNDENLGLVRHFNKIVAAANGEIIVVAAGDDISLYDRVSKTVDVLSTSPDAMFLSFTDTTIDSEGAIIKKPLAAEKFQKLTIDDYLAGSLLPVTGASRGYRKKVFSTFGDLNENCMTEDTTSLLRSLMCGHGYVSTASGILYRRHGKNLSAPVSLQSMNFKAINDQYISDINLARSLCLVDDEKVLRLLDWTERNKRRKILFKEFHESQSKFIFFIKKFLLNTDLKVIERFWMLKRCCSINNRYKI